MFLAPCLPPPADKPPGIIPEPPLFPPDVEVLEEPVDLFLPGNVQNGHVIPNLTVLWVAMYPAAVK
jgi:hypothetical protein